MNLRRILGALLVAAGLAAAAVAVFYALDYQREQAALRRFLAARPAASDPVAVVEDLVTFLGSLPGDETTARMPYRNPLYRFLKARPIDVLENGGFCGNKSRLLVTLLRMRGIPARVVYLYNVEGWKRPDVGQPYVTAFVEVFLDGRWSAVDPYLGVMFRNATGRPATTAELAADPGLVRAVAPKWYKPEFFNYREIRGIRWGKFPMGESVRGGIALLTSPEWANAIHYPFWAHRPNLLLAGIGGIVSVVTLAAGAILLRRRPRRPPGG